MNKITQQMAKELIDSSNGKIFSVVFTKKDGSEREMVARTGVKKHLKGGELAYNPAEYDMVCVFDVQKEGYRMINLDTLKLIKMEKSVFEVV